MSTYVVSDIHGVYPIFEQIKKFLKPEDKCYVLGDCADRASEGWKIIQEVIKDNRFIYLKGNHEQLLIDAADQYNLYGDYYSEDYYVLCSNGGEQTFLNWTYTPYRNEWLYKLKELPTQAKYINTSGKEILLSHAGYTPGKNEYEWDEDLLWDRKHFTDEWDEEKYPNSIIVHGHTPTLYVDAELKKIRDKRIEPGAYWYCNDHKVCIDNGTFATGYSTLLDLDTFEEHIFVCENFVA
jgi:calcineurin-like phosphoesterase family protein